MELGSPAMIAAGSSGLGNFALAISSSKSTPVYG
jgi:hypothetical protein